MKQLKDILFEKLKINSNSKINEYSYHPKDINELEELVNKLIKERGNDANLNDIDVSKLKGMPHLFEYSDFNGDISEWDVSNIENMHCMFNNSKYTGENGDISKWNTNKVKYMDYMFYNSKFKEDISKWDVSNVEDMTEMFKYSPLENKPPKWYKE